MNTLYEFLKEGDGKPSITRLLCLLSFFPASYVLIKSGTEEALGLYLGAYVIGYIGGKHISVRNKVLDDKEEIKDKDEGDSESQ